MAISLSEIIGKGYGAFWYSKARYRVVKGGRGSKKSKTAALWFAWHLHENPQANLLVVRRTFRTLKDSCYSDLLWAFEKLGLRMWKGTTNPLELINTKTKQRILFRGLDDSQKITSISVPKGVLCWVWIEEAFEITKEDDFNKLDMSIRGELPAGLFKQITLTFNPWSANSWLKSRFFDVTSPNIFAATTTYRCNEWLDEGDKALFEEMRINSPRRWNVEANGEWGISEGLIYDRVEYENFNVDEIRSKPGIQAAFGLDFGFTDPNAFVACLVDNGNKKIYIFDEWLKSGVTNREIATEIINRGYGTQKIICDSAEPKSIQELRDNGVRNADASRKGKDSVNHGIQLIQNYTFVIHTNCPETYKALLNYCWAKDKFDKPTDKPEHEFSHIPDAIRYGVTNILLPERFSFD